MSKNENIEERKSNKKFNYIICPQCKESARIIIKNYKFNFSGCKNEHIINNILIKDFKTTQVVDGGKTICQKCNKINENISCNNDIYFCLKCNQNLCESCKSIHDKTHNIINYHEKYFICDLHFESYNSYCLTCKKDLCSYCEFEHKEHMIISYEKMIPYNPKEKEDIDIFFGKKESLKNDIKDIINKLVNLIDSIDNCYDIYKDIINSNSENYRRNYLLLQNINELNKFKNFFISDINKIIEEKDIFNKTNYIMDLYNKIELLNDNYFKTEKITSSISNINDINETPDIKEVEGKTNNMNRNSDDSFINKTIEYNHDYMFISENNEDDNYNNFDINKIKKLLTIKNDKFIFHKVYVLKDGRIITHNMCRNNKNDFLCFIFDLKNDKCFNLNFKEIIELIQMDDGIILIAFESEIMLIDMKQYDFEIIQTIKTECHRIFKLTNDKFLVKINNLGNIFIYKNKNLVLEKQIKLNSFGSFKSYNYYSINEKEIAIYYGQMGFFSYCFFIGFLDLEKDKMIKSFEITNTAYTLDFLSDKILILGNDNKIFQIDISNHSKKKRFKLPKYSYITSILCLNKTKVIVGQYDYINQFEVDKDYKFILISTIEIKNYYLYKYPKSRLLIKPKKDFKTLILYG